MASISGSSGVPPLISSTPIAPSATSLFLGRLVSTVGMRTSISHTRNTATAARMPHTTGFCTKKALMAITVNDKAKMCRFFFRGMPPVSLKGFTYSSYARVCSSHADKRFELRDKQNAARSNKGVVGSTGTTIPMKPSTALSTPAMPNKILFTRTPLFIRLHHTANANVCSSIAKRLSIFGYMTTNIP